ncbi:Doublesex- and mab-3- transcription factor A2 [Homalodisca vitripennis]|nr:Doublesex- and mab-3- transcription factor A2 [Homalodisca vitripennis]KAG8294655.1 Doublesex- and mab-3- transcription factor A2 [Homalodisca vitripennis]
MSSGPKRARISVVDDDGDDSAEPEDLDRSRSRSRTPPPLVQAPPPDCPMPPLALPSSETQSTPPPEDSSSESESAPENLSLPKPRSVEPPSLNTPLYSQYPGMTVPYHHLPQRSPVDVLLRVFPGRRRSDVEATLSRCKGDVLQAIELMHLKDFHTKSEIFCSLLEQSSNLQRNPFTVCTEPEEPRSAFSPLGPPCSSLHRAHFSPQARRFLSAPYSGTGYLPTVIRPPPEYALPLHLYSAPEKTTASSPGSNTGSDKTSYSE